jgi:hypothetical protein
LRKGWIRGRSTGLPLRKFLKALLKGLTMYNVGDKVSFILFERLIYSGVIEEIVLPFYYIKTDNIPDRLIVKESEIIGLALT